MSDMEIPPEALAAAITLTSSRRLHAITQAMMLVANGKLPAWSAFDYAYALDRFMSTGLPPVRTPKPEKRSRRRTIH